MEVGDGDSKSLFMDLQITLLLRGTQNSNVMKLIHRWQDLQACVQETKMDMELKKLNKNTCIQVAYSITVKMPNYLFLKTEQLAYMTLKWTESLTMITECSGTMMQGLKGPSPNYKVSVRF